MSCERLHMAYLDAQSAPAAPPDSDGPSFAEPPAVHPPRDVDDWLRDLESQLSDVDVITVSGEEWLRPQALREPIEALLDRLSARGIRIDRTLR
jgi:hypothetical protein